MLPVMFGQSPLWMIPEMIFPLLLSPFRAFHLTFKGDFFEMNFITPQQKHFGFHDS